MSETDYRNQAVVLAAERGYSHPVLRNGHLIVYTGDGTAVDYANEVLAPLGLVDYDHICWDWREAVRLLGMLPPARGV